MLSVVLAIIFVMLIDLLISPSMHNIDLLISPSISSSSMWDKQEYTYGGPKPKETKSEMPQNEMGWKVKFMPRKKRKGLLKSWRKH